MNEYHFPIVCGLWGNEGELVCIYEFMHVCMNVCISLYKGLCMVVYMRVCTYCE